MQRFCCFLPFGLIIERKCLQPMPGYEGRTFSSGVPSGSQPESPASVKPGSAVVAETPSRVGSKKSTESQSWYFVCFGKIFGNFNSFLACVNGALNPTRPPPGPISLGPFLNFASI